MISVLENYHSGHYAYLTEASSISIHNNLIEGGVLRKISCSAVRPLGALTGLIQLEDDEEDTADVVTSGIRTLFNFGDVILVQICDEVIHGNR